MLSYFFKALFFAVTFTYFWTLLTVSFVEQPALSFLLCCLACFLSFYK